MFYTYLIKNHTTNTFYYGVKYGKDADPKQFWIKYFTSSRYVKELIKQYGKDDFSFEIRKTGFTSRESALKWEHKVLRRMKVLERTDFINRDLGDENWHNKGGYKLSSESKLNQGMSKKNNKIINKNGTTIRIDKSELDLYLSDGWALGFAISPQSTKTGNVKVRKDGILLSIKPSELESYLSDGWIRGDGNKGSAGYTPASKGKLKVRKDGKIISISYDELESYLSAGWVRGDGNKSVEGRLPITDGVHKRYILKTEEIPEGWRIGQPVTKDQNPQQRIDVTCPHCGKIGKLVIMKRWHFDNCKKKELT